MYVCVYICVCVFPSFLLVRMTTTRLREYDNDACFVLICGDSVGSRRGARNIPYKGVETSP